jgi:hypothetical protein
MTGGERVWELTGSMKTTNEHHEVGAALAVSGHPYQSAPAAIKLGVDGHQGSYTAVAQEGHATPRPAQRFAPGRCHACC